MIAALLLRGIFLWLTVSVVMAPVIGWALHRQNRDEWCDDIERLRHGLEDA